MAPTTKPRKEDIKRYHSGKHTTSMVPLSENQLFLGLSLPLALKTTLKLATLNLSPTRPSIPVQAKSTFTPSTI